MTTDDAVQNESGDDVVVSSYDSDTRTITIDYSADLGPVG